MPTTTCPSPSIWQSCWPASAAYYAGAIGDERCSPILRRRRGSPNAQDAGSLREFDVYAFGDKQVDFGTLELRANGKIFRLTLMEAELMRHLIRNSGRIVSRKSILEEVWGLHEDTDTRAIDNFVVRLRKYIEKDPSHPEHLLTVRGVGYRFLPEPAEEK